MSRKIQGKLYRRSWGEATEAEAEATAASGLCSGKITKVIKEIYHNPHTGEKKTTWSVYTRPKTFPSVKASREWSRATETMRGDDKQQKRYGQPYLVRAR